MGTRRRVGRHLMAMGVAAAAFVASCVAGVHGFEVRVGSVALEPGTTFIASLVNTCRDKSVQVEVCVEKAIESATLDSPQFEVIAQHPSLIDADGVQAIEFTLKARERADEVCVRVNKTYHVCSNVTVRTVDKVTLKPVCLGALTVPYRVRSGRPFRIAPEFSGDGIPMAMAASHPLEVDPGTFTQVEQRLFRAPEATGTAKLTPVKPAGPPLALECIDAEVTPPRLAVKYAGGWVSWSVGFDDQGVLCEDGASELTSTTPTVCKLAGGVETLQSTGLSVQVERLTPGVCTITVKHLPTGLTSPVHIDDTQLWFVTTATFDGALGGRDGANEKCAQAAAAGGLSRPRWSAYVATKDQTLGALNLALTGLKGVPFKSAFLVNGQHLSSLGAVKLGEDGAPVTGEAWTGGSVEKAGSARPNCAEWSKADGETGRTGHVSAAPTNNGIEPVVDDVTRPCTERHHLYCVGDVPPVPETASGGSSPKSNGCSATAGPALSLAALVLAWLGRRRARRG